MARGKSKGNSFERLICKQISLWWSEGKRDDIFWRSQTSGARATQRAKCGKKTYGACGDIAAVDPIGTPLLSAFTIELKRGRSHGSPIDVIDRAPSKKDKSKPFEKALLQAYREHKEAGSLGWMLICKRDYCMPMVYADTSTLRKLEDKHLFKAPCIHFNVHVQTETGKQKMRFVAMALDTFLKRVSPRALSMLA